ncbi:hypothetical protein DIPPA_11296 [Diplonema papillatum]|nr:hypothetical protein DIPPA_11296 [Diplonema papillatum]
MQLQDLKDEIAKVRQAASDKEDLLEKYRVDAVSWKMEKTQLLAEMTTGEQELERVRNSLKELEESLEVASRERHTALSKTKEAEGALAQVASARVISEERSTELQTKIDGLVRSEALLHERVQCLVVSNQELARSAEVERIQHQAGARVLENRVVQLTEALDKLTLSMKKEQGMSQNARRSLEAVEAVNKRIEAEKTLLEATIQAHGDRVVSVSEPNATFDRNNTSFSTNLTNSPSFHCHAPTPPAVDPTGADELWAVINDLESSKKATEAKHAAEVEELTKNAAAVVHDKEALWQECERLTRQLEGLQATQGSTTPCTTAEADSQTDVTSPQCPAALSLSTGRTFLATFTELSFSESAVKAAAPDASPALLGGVTRFGFVPPSSLWDRFPGSPASSGAMTDRRDRRRSALQDARNARKAEVSVAQASSRQHAYDSILGDVRWSPPMQQTPR